MTKTPPAPVRRTRSRGTVSRALVAAATCSTLACSGGPQVRPQVLRPTPPPEECPPGAVEAMRKLGIDPDRKFNGTFMPFGEGARRIPMREGREFRLRTLEDLGQLPQQTVLFGRLVRGEYLFGRFTEARTPKGERYPVCIKMLEGGGIQHGVEILEGSTDDTAIIRSTVYLRAVDHFE